MFAGIVYWNFCSNITKSALKQYAHSHKRFKKTKMSLIMHDQSHRICRQVSEGNFNVKGSNFNLLEAQNRRSTPSTREYKTITEHTVHVIVHGAD